MKFTIEKRIGDYDPDILFPIWQEGLEVDERRLDWSYRNNVNNTPTVYLVKNTTNNEYFGSLTIFPREYYLEQKKVMGGTTGDFCIKKAYRSLGPALALQKHVLQNLNSGEVLLTFPNNASEKVAIRAGFRPIGNVVAYAKPLKASYVLKKLNQFSFLKNFSTIINILLFIKNFKIIRSREVFVNDSGEKIDERFDKLWENSKSGFSLIGDRSSRYLLWRFFKNPYRSYKILTVEKEKELLGYFVFYTEDHIAYIDDFLWKGFSDRYFADLFNNFTVFCRKSGYEAIHLNICYNPKIDALLKQNGFVKKKTGGKILFSNPKLLKATGDNVLITKGDDDF